MNEGLLNILRVTKKRHKEAMRNRFAREILGSSVIRVFKSNTKSKLIPAFVRRVDINKLKKIKKQSDYDKWHSTNTKKIARVIVETNKGNKRIIGGEEWGHATKILNLYVSNCVLRNRILFKPKEVKVLEKFLHIPIDNLIIKELKRCKIKVPSNNIKGITNKHRYYEFQNIIRTHSEKIKIAPIYFDDYVWGLREKRK